jgi:hypothetical protein
MHLVLTYLKLISFLSVCESNDRHHLFHNHPALEHNSSNQTCSSSYIYYESPMHLILLTNQLLQM